METKTESENSGLPQIKSIILALDGSESSLRACEAAATIAGKFKSSVTAVYVIPKSLSVRAGPSVNDQARASLEKAIAMLVSYEGVRASSDVIEADSLSVSESLINYTEKKECDLVICGSRGLGGFERMVLGSVSANLSSHCHSSVMVVRSIPNKKIGFSKILVATDGSESATKGVRLALSLGRNLSSKLTFANVVYVPPISYTAGEGDWFNRAITEERTEATKVTQEAKSVAVINGVEADTKVIDNMSSPVSALTKLAEEENYDLIVVGTRGLSGIKRLALGSIASGVVHYSKCSVLVAK